MEVSEMIEQVNKAKEEKQRTIKLLEDSYALYERQEEGMRLQIEAMIDKPQPIEANCKYKYELDYRFIEGRVIMEKARYEADLHQIKIKKDAIKTQVEQMKLEMTQNE